jgi:predicted nucleic acid-binding protein
MERREEKVIDASVAMKWFVEEEGSDRALRLRGGHLDGSAILIAPDLMVHEVANALRYRPGFKHDDASSVIADIYKLQIDLFPPSRELVTRWLELAYKYDLTVYDACYLGLGELLGIEVVTADKAFHQKAHGCGFIRLL